MSDARFFKFATNYAFGSFRRVLVMLAMCRRFVKGTYVLGSRDYTYHNTM